MRRKPREKTFTEGAVLLLVWVTFSVLTASYYYCRSLLYQYRQKQKQDRMPEQLWSGYAILTFSDQTWTSTETMVLGKGVAIRSVMA